MYDISNPLSANSYTNKDFQSIYVELLETAKKLAHRWDPTISNESDPGVVLLKLDAIIGDKNNYNIDKNVLENYPETYTQERSARSQYKQLGYKMAWYQSATTRMSFRWVGRKLAEGETLTIPKHTMLTDTDSSVVFTTMRDCTIGKADGVSMQDAVDAKQGILTQLKISGESIIRLSNIDSRNRLYINDSRIAENGIIVVNCDSPEDEWAQVENVELTPSGTKCYEFNIDSMNNVPYLQFADDIRDTIGSGLHIKYLITNGYSGNVAANLITRFYDETSVDIKCNRAIVESVTLGEDNVVAYNVSGTTDGSDPETLEDAYRNFKRRVATFDTLVTLRDYVNAIYTTGLVSNVIVSDRTTDIQSSYKIFDKRESSLVDCLTYQVADVDTVSFSAVPIDYKYDGTEQLHVWDAVHNKLTPCGSLTPEAFNANKNTTNYYHLSNVKTKKMGAFDLKFYLLQNGGLLNDWESYNKTFDIDDSALTRVGIDSYIADSKSIQHDIKDIEPYTPFMMQNVYPIKIKIVPVYKLTNAEIEQVIDNVWKSLSNLLNSRKCEFGNEPNYDIIYNAIRDCDERIKVVILDDFVFTTFAMYLDIVEGKRVFKSIPISDYSNCERIISRESITTATAYNRLKDSLSKLLSTEGTTASLDSLKALAKNYLFIDTTEGNIYIYNDEADDKLELYSDKLLEIRKQVIVKNILAGVTPLFDVDSKFNISLGMNEVPEMSKSTYDITTGLTLKPFGTATEVNPNKTSTTYTLRENENLRFLAPSFITDATYSNYVKFEMVLANPVFFDTTYKYADPANSAELFKKYDRTQFYTKNSAGIPSVIMSESYEPLVGECPKFKLDSYYGRTVGAGNVINHSVLTNPSIAVAIDYADVSGIINSQKYRPKFEQGLYYSFQVGDGDVTTNDKPKFVLATLYPSDWSTEYKDSAGNTLYWGYEKYYRLKQYVEGYVKLSEYYNGGYGPAFVAGDFYAPTYTEVDGDEAGIDLNDKSTWKEDFYLQRTVNVYSPVTVSNADTLPSGAISFTTWCGTDADGKPNWADYYYQKSPETLEPTDDPYGELKEVKGGKYYPNKAMYTVLYKKLSVTEGGEVEYEQVSSEDIQDDDWYNDGSGGKSSWKDYYYYVDTEKQYVSLYVKYVDTENADNNYEGYNPSSIPGSNTSTTEEGVITVISGALHREEDYEYDKITSWETIQDNIDNLYRQGYTVVSTKPDDWSGTWEDYYIRCNKCEYAPDYQCFEEVGEYLTTVYTAVKVGNDIVGYNMVKPGDTQITGAQYYKGVNPPSWETEYKNYRVRVCSQEGTTSGGLTGVIYQDVQKVAPDFAPGSVFVMNSNTQEMQSFEDIGGSPSAPANWETTYTSYYKYNGAQPGLLDNSLQMASWLAGRIQLYVPEMSYRIPANTEYQLRSGDYLTFFWRETDEDDAPFNYVRYTDIYDDETREPTIIKASFAINASPVSDCLINPQKLASSGKIYYDNNASSTFGVISGMYGEHDLSGTKKIEMRKMNSIKMNKNDNKYYYFVTNNKGTSEGKDVFQLTMNKVGTRNSNYAKYTYTIDNDEYFIYTNSNKTGFEALGAGTLIEYYEYYESNPDTAPATHQLEVPVVNVQNIAYNGIDAFVNECKEVTGKNYFSLVEQQIYSFTNGDKVHIQMDEKAVESYERVSTPVFGSGEKYYIDDASYIEVGMVSDGTGTEAPPPFVMDYYYYANYDSGTGALSGAEIIHTLPQKAPVYVSDTYYEKGTDDKYTKLKGDAPDDWDTNYNNYYIMSNNTYFKVTGISLWTDKDDGYFSEEEKATKRVCIKSSSEMVEIGSAAEAAGKTVWKQKKCEYPIYTGTPSPVHNYSVSYSTSTTNSNELTGSGFELLPQISITDSDYCWNASSHLNISSSSIKPQKIEPETDNSIQSIKIGTITYPDDSTAEGGVIRFREDSPIYLVTDITLDKVGGSGVDVSWVDLSNNRHPTDVFLYQLNDSFSDPNWSYLDDGTLMLKVNCEGGANVIKEISEIHLDPNFEYILPVKVFENGDSTASNYEPPEIVINEWGNITNEEGVTTKGWVPLNCVCHDESSLSADLHFIGLPSGTTNLQVSVTGGSSSEDISIKFGFLFKYKKRDLFEGTTKNPSPKYSINTQAIIEELRKLDVPGVFDYTHIPEPSTKIDDPLSPQSFFEPQHVFNSVTLPRAELRFSNQVGIDLPFDSEVIFVNNR